MNQTVCRRVTRKAFIWINLDLLGLGTSRLRARALPDSVASTCEWFSGCLLTTDNVKVK